MSDKIILQTASRKVDSVWLRTELIASWPEIIAVLLFVIGRPAYVSAWNAMNGSAGYYVALLSSNTFLFHGMVWETSMLAVTLALLHWRGWAAADFKIKMSWWSSLQGLFLWFAMKVGFAVVLFIGFVIMFVFFQHFVRSHSFLGVKSTLSKVHISSPNLLLSIVSSVINAYWEELTCMGYAFNQFAAKRGPLFALWLTVVLRMSCHTYQGLLHMAAAGGLFVVAGCFYWRTRNLWPLILAHTIYDAFPFSFLLYILKGLLLILHHV